MRLPEKDDQFTHDQSRVQNRDGWLLHPLDESRAAPAGRRQASVAPGYPTNVQRSKPEPAEPTGRNLFGLGSTGRPGVTWAMAETLQALRRGRHRELAPCPGSKACRFAEVSAKYARSACALGMRTETGAPSCRTTSFNTIHALAARLRYFRYRLRWAAGLPAAGTEAAGKSTTQSHRAPIFCRPVVPFRHDAGAGDHRGPASGRGAQAKQGFDRTGWTRRQCQGFIMARSRNWTRRAVRGRRVLPRMTVARPQRRMALRQRGSAGGFRRRSPSPALVRRTEARSM